MPGPIVIGTSGPSRRLKQDIGEPEKLYLTDPLGVVLEAWFNRQLNPLGSHISGITGWYGGVGVHTEQSALLGDGAAPDWVRRTGRNITVSGFYGGLSSSSSTSVARALSGLFGGARNESLGELTIEHGGFETLTCQVQLDSDVKVVRSPHAGIVEWQLQLYAPDPRLYGVPRTSQVPVMGNGIGLQYDLFLPGMLYFGEDVAVPLSLSHAGNSTAYPVYTVMGDYPYGFSILQDGLEINYVRPAFSNAPVTIDTSGTVLVNGMDRTGDVVAAVWAGIKPGQSMFAELTSPSGSGVGTVTIRDTYL